MSDVKNFDTHFKDHLGNYTADVPSRVWDNIVAQREKRKPVGFWAGLLTPRNIAVVAALIIVGTAGTLLVSDNDTTKADDPNKTTILTSIPPTADKTTNTTFNKSDKIENASINTDNKTIGITGNREPLNNEEKLSNTPVKFNNTVALSKDNASIKLNIGDNNHNDILTEDYNELQTSMHPSLMRRLLMGVEKTPYPTAVAGLKLKSRAFPNVALPDCPVMERDAAGDKKYFEIYAGPDYGLRTFTDSLNPAYLQKRKESTKFSSAYSAGFRYTRVFKNAMSVRAGLNYSQINEKFTFVESNVTQVTYVIDPITGDTTGQYSVSGTRIKTTHNRYHTIDIPLSVGYEIGNGRFHANINAGPIINVYNWQKGEVLDTLNKPVSINSGSQSPYQYKTGIGIGLTGGVSAYYKLTDQLHLLAEPYIRYNLSQMQQEALTLKQKYTIIGLRLGVRFDLP